MEIGTGSSRVQSQKDALKVEVAVGNAQVVREVQGNNDLLEVPSAHGQNHRGLVVAGKRIT
jgi:hypothetical protein